MLCWGLYQPTWVNYTAITNKPAIPVAWNNKVHFSLMPHIHFGVSLGFYPCNLYQGSRLKESLFLEHYHLGVRTGMENHELDFKLLLEWYIISTPISWLLQIIWSSLISVWHKWIHCLSGRHINILNNNTIHFREGGTEEEVYIIAKFLKMGSRNKIYLWLLTQNKSVLWFPRSKLQKNKMETQWEEWKNHINLSMLKVYLYL